MIQLRQNLPEGITWQNVLGGLAPDNDEPMPAQTRQMVQDHWHTIQSSVGTEFNFDFWEKCQPRRDTYKACRAVIAASQQQAEETMIEAIQRAYYLQAMNPSETETLADIAAELGLDRAMFVEDLTSEQTEIELHRQLLLRGKLYVRSFPSLVLEHGDRRMLIKHDYQDHQISLRQIQDHLSRAPAGAN
jgi:putative protein-disulfide isomerase